MNAPRLVQDSVVAVQHRASDPAVSAWVSANAGSGKTHVLAQRVIRLLLKGTDPSKILCLTFTKAAAANMANRVFSELARWTALDDAALDRAMHATGAKDIDAGQRARARRLFASALDTPGGLKVQTIHGFCTRLLQQFPFEANVAARFRVLESVQQRQLLETVRLGVLLDAAARPDGVAGKAMAQIIAVASDAAFHTALDEAVDRRDDLAAWIDHAGGIDAAVADLSRQLGVDANDSPESIVAEFLQSPHLAAGDWKKLIDILARGSKTDAQQGERLAAALAASGAARSNLLVEFFCTGEREPRKSLVTKAIRGDHPDLYQRLLAEQTRICAVMERQRAVAIRDRTAALIRIASEVIARYSREKDRRGLLDYDDQIAKARDLLTRVEAAWVHYKLDRGIDHLLIDEAQDTSPEQWEIVRPLVAEFTAGAGARPANRSIFVVGDDKQSIFSFQGAEPAAFDHNRRAFLKSHAEAGAAFESVEFKFSFRSAPAVLQAVDEVFKHPSAHEGLTSDPVPTAHSAVRDRSPGLVELWDIVAPEDRPEVEPWDAPFDRSSETSPRVKLARTIAGAVHAWIARGDLVGDGDNRRPVRAGDILILVRQRGPLFEAIIRALKSAGIPVAGADRLVLTEHIAVMDLMVLADAILLPQDDLALATVLKSPLFGLTDEELFTLAWQRQGTLRAALRDKRPDLAAEFDAIAAGSGESPFAFYAQLLGARHGRRKFLARLGPEANDALDEFLNLALDYESRETPTLQGFVAWLRTASAEIKRDMEIARDEVRVMTVHGAKGLEAPVVILADTTSRPSGPSAYQPRLLPLAAQNAAPATPDGLVWMPNKDDDIAPVAAARQAGLDAAENEHRRLLYVAMTRAADRLVVCGAIGKTKKPEGCWYDLVNDGLAATGTLTAEPADFGEATVKRYRKSALDVIESASRSEPEASGTAAMPGWLHRPLPAAKPRAVLTPSSDDDAPRFSGSADARAAALKRGQLVHRLLQSLPDVPPARREAAARAYLARNRDALSDADTSALAAQVTAILADERFAALFAPGSRAEVPIVGHITLNNGTVQAVSGQVDRLVVTDGGILIADYKTNRPAPRRIEDVPHPYVRQLALYRALLTDLYPGKTMRAALVWTDVPDLMELSAAALDAEIDALIRS